MCTALKNHSRKADRVGGSYLIRYRRCHSAFQEFVKERCDAAEFDAERLLLRKPGERVNRRSALHRTDGYTRSF